VATAVGPFLGGWLIGAVSWRLVFFINLPVAAGVIAVAGRHVPESRDPDVTGRVDLPGALLVTAGLAGVTYGLTVGPVNGWTAPATLTALIAGVASLIGFVAVERRTAAPLLPPDIFASAQFSGANAVTFAVYGALGGALFLLPVQLQGAVGYSALAAGASLLPVTVAMLLLSNPSAALANRIGPRLQMTVGPAVVAAGLALMTRIGPGSAYTSDVLPAVTVLGLGLAATVAPLTATVLAAAPSRHSGVASAVNNDVARAAGLLAVAVLPAIAGLEGQSYTDPTKLSSAFHTAVLVAAAVAFFGAVLAFATIRNPDRAGRPARARPARPCWNCALDGPPAPPAPVAAGGGPGVRRPPPPPS
jgi:MFS family permease